MTTYVLGAGASIHAGYPPCSALWSRMAQWAIESQPVDSEFRKAVDLVAVVHGPANDIESMFTDLDLGRAPFNALNDDDRKVLRGRIRGCLRRYFCSIGATDWKAPLYEELARTISNGDMVVTFNYDVSLEGELVRAGRFRVRNGYGFRTDWDERDSDVIVLKLHGSINWIGLVFGEAKDAQSSLGERPFVDNVDSVLPDYPNQVLDKSFRGGGVTDGAVTLVLPTQEKRFSVNTSLANEWTVFYESLWSQAAECLHASDRIVIIGYSLPAADRRSRAILLKGANKRAEIVVCCAASNESIRREFEDNGFWRVREVGRFEDFLNISG